MWGRTLSLAFAFMALTVSADTPQDEQNQVERNLKTEAEMWSFGSTACECKSTPRPCLFIHGERNEKEEKELLDKSDMFGDMKDHAPCCSSIKYASLNTLTVRWTDDTLQETVCKHALSMSPSSDAKKGIIEDTILVTHSMGALIVAGAVANEKCSIANSTSWVSMSAPMNGTMASNYVQNICTDDDTQAFNKILTLLGKCPVGAGMKSLASMGGKYSTMDLNEAFVAAQEVYRKHVTAAMCSNDDIGIVSTNQAEYLILGSNIEFKTDQHDGFVEYESCRGGLPESQFSDSYEDRFYVSKCNHADTAFLNGNSYFRETIKPVNWFECLL
uniref:GPI inositol-deacylase n=1 Tax=Phytophthora ramorum TaxID=164328 RepID=H3GW82_PHYRM